MVTISLCMIVKNEEDVLERCLSSVKDVVDEIIVVDTGSTDQTKEIARRFTPHVFDFTWIDDFSAARNASFEKASCDYCMWLDADDVLLQEDAEKLLKWKQEEAGTTDVVMAPYHTGFDSKGNPTYTYYRERILRRGKYRWAGRVHEAITPSGQIRYGEFCVTHKKEKPSNPNRNLQIYEAQKAAGEPFSARDAFYYGRELYYHSRYKEAAEVLEGFLEDPNAWIENRIEGCRFLARCYDQFKQTEKALLTLCKTFTYDSPRAEVCCDLGAFFLKANRLEQAAFWYETALTRPRRDTSGGFVQPECYGYLPCIQLCVCYDRMGNRPLASQYNKRAGRYRPAIRVCNITRNILQNLEFGKGLCTFSIAGR